MTNLLSEPQFPLRLRAVGTFLKGLGGGKVPGTGEAFGTPVSLCAPFARRRCPRGLSGCVICAGILFGSSECDIIPHKALITALLTIPQIRRAAPACQPAGDYNIG